MNIFLPILSEHILTFFIHQIKHRNADRRFKIFTMLCFHLHLDTKIKLDLYIRHQKEKWDGIKSAPKRQNSLEFIIHIDSNAQTLNVRRRRIILTP